VVAFWAKRVGDWTNRAVISRSDGRIRLVRCMDVVLLRVGIEDYAEGKQGLLAGLARRYEST